LSQPATDTPIPFYDGRGIDRQLVRHCDIQGVLHSHTLYGDGAHSLRAMVETAREIGLSYLGISDHYCCASREQGLDADSIARQREEINGLKKEFPGFEIFQGVEVDAREDGSLPVADEMLERFDYVIVSLPDGNQMEPTRLTEALVKIAMNPHTTILSKPIGDFMLRKPPVPVDMESVLQAAAKAAVALEIDANPQSLDLDWSCCNRAQELGVMLSINPNAHRAARLVDYRHGVELARDAGICCRSIINTMSGADLRTYLSRRR
jgi:DNA polymerase (family 10)